MGGKIYTPLGAWYHATKYALEALSDCLRMELKPFGIDVVVIEPGAIKTEWNGIAADKLRAVSGTGPYADQANAVADSIASESTRRRSSPPEVIAKTIGKAVTARRPKTRYAVGYGAKPMIFLHGVLPDRAFDAFIRRAVECRHDRRARRAPTVPSMLEPENFYPGSHASPLEREAAACALGRFVVRPRGARRVLIAHSATARLMTQLRAITESCVSSFSGPATISATISVSICVAAPRPIA